MTKQKKKKRDEKRKGRRSKVFFNTAECLGFLFVFLFFFSFFGEERGVLCSLYYKFFLGVVSTTPNELAKKVFFFFFLVFFFFDDDDDSDDDERATSHRSGQVRGRTERAESGREEGTHTVVSSRAVLSNDLRFRISLF